MNWRVEISASAHKQLRKLDRVAAQRLVNFLRQRVATDEDPRMFGKPLRHGLQGLWRYRVDDYRLICQIEGNRFLVVVLQIGHRREVYR